MLSISTLPVISRYAFVIFNFLTSDGKKRGPFVIGSRNEVSEVCARSKFIYAKPRSAMRGERSIRRAIFFP